MPTNKKIVLIDDHTIVRTALKELIEKIGPYEITKQFEDGQSFLNAVPFKEDVDLIMMDINMPGMNGDEVMEKLKAMSFKTPVLILTLNEEEDLIIKLFRLGVRAYLTKNTSAPEMRKALDQIFTTGYYHNEFMAYSIENQFKPLKENEAEKILQKLSQREREFLKLACHEAEYTYEQMADIMKVNVRTVNGYRQCVFDKYAIKSKTGLVLFVLKHKLIDHL